MGLLSALLNPTGRAESEEDEIGDPTSLRVKVRTLTFRYPGVLAVGPKYRKKGTVILFNAGSGTGSGAGAAVGWIGEMTLRLDPSPFAEMVAWLELWLVKIEGLRSALELRRLSSSVSCCSSGLEMIEALRFRPGSSVGVVLVGTGATGVGGWGGMVDAKESPRSFW